MRAEKTENINTIYAFIVPMSYRSNVLGIKKN